VQLFILQFNWKVKQFLSFFELLLHFAPLISRISSSKKVRLMFGFAALM